MIPWTLLDSAQTPGDGVLLSLYQRGTEFSIKAGNYELMNSRVYGSEDALAKLACQKISKHPRARVLIGGLGIGYTLRSAGARLPQSGGSCISRLRLVRVLWL